MRSDNDPEVIKAKAAARVQVLEARAKLHPLAQAIYTFFDGIGDIIGQLGCLIILIIIVLGFAAPTVLPAITHFLFGGG